MIAKLRSLAPAAAGFGIPFLFVAYLALEAGGYDIVLRSQFGIIVWWAVLLGAALGMLPVLRVTRAGLLALTVLGALALWSGLATLIWTESAERSMVEFSRLATLLGLFALLLLVQGRDGLRRSLGGLAGAVTLVAVVALTDRFLPDILSSGYANELPLTYPRARLAYPLEYWNGLAALMAIGLAGLLWAVASGITRLGRAIAAGAIPLVLLVLYMTASRGGIAAALVVVATLLLIFPQRVWLVLVSLPSLIGTLALVAAVNARPQVRDLIEGNLTSGQGKQMATACALVFLVVAASSYAISRLVESGMVAMPRIGYRATRWTGIATGLAVLALLSAGFASGFLGDRWTEFKQPAGGETTVNRLGNLNSSERYLLWDSALEAADSEKLTGIGPGTFEYWWAREGEGVQFVRDAHSLYLEALAEMGPVALVLVLMLVFGPIAFGSFLAFRHGPNERRGQIAAAVSGMMAFAVAAGLDWAWEMTVLPVAFFVLAAAVLGSDAEVKVLQKAEDLRPRALSVPLRVGVAAVSLAAIAAIAVPLAGTQLLRSSQSLAASGQLERALDRAELASRVQPFAASPKVQEAQLLWLLNREDEAAVLARQAIDAEPGNWRNWFVLAQTLARSSPNRARAAAARARMLNPGLGQLSAEPGIRGQ